MWVPIACFSFVVIVLAAAVAFLKKEKIRRGMRIIPEKLERKF